MWQDDCLTMRLIPFRGSVPVFHEDVKVWDVTDITTGNHIGLWYLDPYAREGKRSGAWAPLTCSHTTFDGKQMCWPLTIPILSSPHQGATTDFVG